MVKSNTYSRHKIWLNNFIKQNFGNMKVDGPRITESCIVKTLCNCEESILDIEINVIWRLLEHQFYKFLHFWLCFWGDDVFPQITAAALKFLIILFKINAIKKLSSTFLNKTFWEVKLFISNSNTNSHFTTISYKIWILFLEYIKSNF